MNKSIYTEYANLTPYNIKWLDECGAKWAAGQTFSEIRYKRIEFTNWSDRWCFTASGNKNYTHLPTGDAFCQGVAEILDIEYVPEGTKTETTTEDKGLAIDVKLLSEENREWLNINKGQPLPWDKGWGFCTFDRYDLLCLAHKNYLEEYKISITTDPTEFMRYVADKTGKEWGERERHDTPEMEARIKEVLSVASGIALENLKAGEAVVFKEYPHKTYRILDSLDGVPLDKRIPLSEWIPPPREKVLLITGERYFEAWVQYIDNEGIRIGSEGLDFFTIADGHWMRIV